MRFPDRIYWQPVDPPIRDQYGEVTFIVRGAAWKEWDTPEGVWIAIKMPERAVEGTVSDVDGEEYVKMLTEIYTAYRQALDSLGPKA